MLLLEEGAESPGMHLTRGVLFGGWGLSPYTTGLNYDGYTVFQFSIISLILKISAAFEHKITFAHSPPFCNVSVPVFAVYNFRLDVALDVYTPTTERT